MLKRLLFILSAIVFAACADKPRELTEHDHQAPPSPIAEKFTDLDLSTVEVDPSSIISDTVETDPTTVEAGPQPQLHPEEPIPQAQENAPKAKPFKPKTKSPKPITPAPVPDIAPKPEPEKPDEPAPAPAPAQPAPAQPQPQTPPTPAPAPAPSQPKKPVEVKPQPKPEQKPEAKKPAPKEEVTPKAPVVKPTVVSEVKNQAFGSPTRGRLQNAANLYEYQLSNPNVPFTIHSKTVASKKYFSTDELADFIIEIADYFVSKINPNRKIIVTQLSLERGGLAGKSMSHQNGVDADLRYVPFNPTEDYRIDLNNHDRSTISRSLNVEAHFNMFLEATKTGYVNVIFVHQLVKESLCAYASAKGQLNDPAVINMLSHVWIEKHHSTHFHVRVACDPKTQPQCRNNPELLIRSSKGEVVSGCHKTK